MPAVCTIVGQLKPPSCSRPKCSCRFYTTGTSCLGPWSLLCSRCPRFDRHRGETSVPILLLCWAGCELHLKEEKKNEKTKKSKIKVKDARSTSREII